jgi:hypothetical protein
MMPATYRAHRSNPLESRESLGINFVVDFARCGERFFFDNSMRKRKSV